MIVDGHEEFVGSDAGRAGKAIASAIVAPHAIVSLGVTYNTETTEPTEKSKENNLNDLRGLCELCVVRVFVDVANLPKLSRGDRADVFVAVTESHLRSDVRGGENRGRTLSHAPVVRQIVTVGEAGAGALQTRLSLNTAWKREHLTMVAFVQERFSRRVLGAAAVPLSSAAK
jgi:hypothetical protein